MPGLKLGEVTRSLLFTPSFCLSPSLYSFYFQDEFSDFRSFFTCLDLESISPCILLLKGETYILTLALKTFSGKILSRVGALAL